jgi:tetratricopeptide (TPR) repeat protein/transcriptional regulator with XRE-family HTH domain
MGAKYPGPFAMLLRQYRAEAGLTQEELAERAQLSPKAVSSLERGIRTRPHRVTVALLGDALGISEAQRSELERAARTGVGPEPSELRSAGIPSGAFLGSAPSGRIVARESELLRLRSAIEAVDAGSGRLMLLAGEAGVGKTRLAQETYTLARSTGFMAAAGRCYEQQSSVPYFPFLEALGTVYTSCPEDLRQTVPRRWPHLHALLPDVPEFRDAVPSGPHDEQVLVFRAVAAFLCAVADRQRLALFLDDLHWADVSSLQLLHHVARETRGDKVFLLAAYRDADSGGQDSLTAVLRDLNREGLAELVRVSRLDLEATREMIADVLGQTELSEELGPLVYERAEGNAYFVQQIVSALSQEVESLTPEAVRELGVPDTIRAVVVQRLDRLTPESQEILAEAAVLGQEFSFDDLQAMSDREEDAVETAIEEATLCGLVRETAAGGSTFDHGLTQQTLYERLPARRRMRLHVSAGQAIAQLPDWQRRPRIGELAWHFLQGRDRPTGLHWSLIAGDQAWTVSAMAEAEHHYGVAAQLAREIEDEAAAARALEGLGRLFNVLARYGESREALEEANRLYETLRDVAGRGRVAVELGGLYFMEGRPDDGIECVQHALDRLEADPLTVGPSSPASELYAALGQLLWPAGRREEALSATERAADLAREVGDVRTRGWADMQRALMLEGLGRRREALETAESALRFVRGTGFDDLQWYSLSVLSNMYSDRGNLAAARETIDLGLEAAQRRGDPQYLAASMAELARYKTWVGEWPEAEKLLAEAATCVGPEDPIARFIGAVKARLDLWRGDVDRLESDLTKIIEASEASGNLDRLTMASVLMAEYEVGEGRAADALDRLERLATLRGVRVDDPSYLTGLGLTYLSLGRVHEAMDPISRGVDVAEPDNLRMPLADLRLLEGRALSADHRLREAEAAIQESIALSEEMPVPYKHAQALVELSHVLAAQGSTGASRAYLEKARAILEELGARRALDQVQVLLRTQPV